MGTKLLKTLLLFTLVGFSAFAKVKVEKISYAKENNYGVVTVKYKGKMIESPELTVKGSVVQIAIPNSVVWPKVEKEISINNKFDSKLMAYQYNKDLVRVRTKLPYDLKGKENKVSVILEDDLIKFYFPLMKSSKTVLSNGLKKAVTKTAYDESYLDKLLKDKVKTKNDKVVKMDNVESFLTKETKKDSLKLSSSAVKKNSFSMTSYIAKFIGFFAVMVGGIYLLMNFFRKGMIKKGGLGFLTNTKIVEVVSTTYLGPKRSILVVRVNKQFFLMSQSEKGMDFLTEITDTTSFMKEGEKQVAGTNFDTNLDTAVVDNKDFKLKDMTSALDSETTTNQDNADILKALTQSEDKVSLSNQIKNKIKNLKTLQ